MDTVKEEIAVQNIHSSLDNAIILLSTVPSSGSAHDLVKQYETEKFCFEWRTQKNPINDAGVNSQYLVNEIYHSKPDEDVSFNDNRKKLLDTKG